MSYRLAAHAKPALLAVALLGSFGCGDTSTPSTDELFASAGMTAEPVAGEMGGVAGTSAGTTATTAGTGTLGPDDMPTGAAGTDGTAGIGEFPAADGGVGDASDIPAVKPKCLEKESQVVVLGDSYINWVSHTMPTDLKTVSNQTWRMHAVGAASMGSGGASFIPDQLTAAIKEDPDMKVIVMTGGGNDILVPDANKPGSGDCKMRADSPTLPVCQEIVQQAIDKAESLMDDVADKGVTDVIYFFYPEVPEGTLIGGTHPRAMLNYALPKVRATCEGAEARTSGKLRCHFIDTIPLFKGHDDWFAPTDIHENSLGSMAIAKEIWKVMQTHCIAQKAPNACCEP